MGPMDVETAPEAEDLKAKQNMEECRKLQREADRMRRKEEAEKKRRKEECEKFEREEKERKRLEQKANLERLAQEEQQRKLLEAERKRNEENERQLAELRQQSEQAQRALAAMKEKEDREAEARRAAAESIVDLFGVPPPTNPPDADATKEAAGDAMLPLGGITATPQEEDDSLFYQQLWNKDLQKAQEAARMEKAREVLTAQAEAAFQNKEDTTFFELQLENLNQFVAEHWQELDNLLKQEPSHLEGEMNTNKSLGKRDHEQTSRME